MGKISKETIDKVLAGLEVTMHDAGIYHLSREDIAKQREELKNDIYIRIEGQDTPYWEKKHRKENLAYA